MHPTSGPARIRFGAFELDPTSGELSKRGVRMRLHDKPYQLLMALLERPGETITRKELQERLWPGGTFVEFENGINNAVSRLRDALGDSAESPRYIETLPRRGYRFIAPLEPAIAGAAAVAAAPMLEPDARDDAESTRRAVRTSRSPLIASVAATVIAAAVLTLIWTRGTTRAAVSLAVLPFVAANAAERAQDEYLAFGMTDALIGELSRIGALKVTSQTSAMQYKGARKTLPEIARELGVSTVVEGSVVHEGEQVRVTVQLIDARTDAHLWTQTYTRDPVTALSTQRALAREVSSVIRSRLVPWDRSSTPVPQQTTPAAYDAYLKGRYFIQQPGEAPLARAREFFEQAIAADPAFAPAHAGLSNYFALTDSLPPADAIPKAKSSARRALALDESSAVAHAALAYVHYFGDWDWAAADREFARAIELDPSDARSRRWHALYLSSMGREAAALEEIQRAIELDPVSVSVFDAAGAIWSNARRFDRVLEQADRIRELSPRDPRGFLHRVVAYVQQRQYAQAIEAAHAGMAVSERDPAFLCLLAAAQHGAGQPELVRQTMREIDQLAAKGWVPRVFLAWAYLWMGDRDAALRLLQEAYEGRDPYLVVAKVAPWFDPLRDDPGFRELLGRMRFPQ